MGKRKRGRHGRGHFCWCCGRHRPNERFSGRGHRDHICRDCQTLPADERSFRQAVRNMERLVDWDGRLRRKARAQLDPFLKHASSRVRDHAEELLRRDAEARVEIREAYRREEEAWELASQVVEREEPPPPGCWKDLPF